MIKVTALTSGRNVPSSRFRVRQFIEPLSHFGIQVSEYPLRLRKYTPKISPPIRFLVDACKTAARVPGLLAARTSDITWLERELVPRRLTLEHWASSKRLFDVDDAIWLTGDSAFSEEIAIKCYGVIAGNEFLAEHYRCAGARVWVVPTSIDTDRWQPLPKPQDRSWVVGWTGTSSNLRCLESLEEPLADFLTQHPETKLVVVCDRKPSFKRISPDQWSFERWSRAREVQLVQRMDVGLMPLPDTEWSLGKCAFKMIIYMAVGIPVVVSPIGANKDVLQQADVGLAAVTVNDWFEALRLLFHDRERAAGLGSAGRQLVEDNYSVGKNAGALARIFQEAASF
ncbi:MAG TPA: glycosyltransferase family 4 protein [Pyrinomonadaceae bacterium]|nr:glycosyltransferase family 4 protein [Pyrinomonadaceae bacterium]